MGTWGGGRDRHMWGRGMGTYGEFGLHVRGRMVMGPFGRRDGHMWVEGRAHSDYTPLIVWTIHVCTQQVLTCGI
jgi:hypothetical protein